MASRVLFQSKLFCDPLYTQNHVHTCTHISQEKMDYKNAMIITNCIFTCGRCLDKMEIKKHTHLKGRDIQVVRVTQGQTFW